MAILDSMIASATVTKPAVSGAAADAVATAQPGCPPRFRFIDVFAGIGGMRAGLEMADAQCVFTIENDPHACRTYSANWGSVEPLDVRSVNPYELPEYEVLAAGFPWQRLQARKKSCNS